jgi:hypothetical protein
MNPIAFCLSICIFLCNVAGAEEPSVADSSSGTFDRTNATDKFYLTADYGVAIRGESGFSGRSDLGFRFDSGSWGVLFNWHVFKFDSLNRLNYISGRNSIFAVGGMYRVLQINGGPHFWRGSYLSAQLLVQRGSSHYSASRSANYGSPSVDAASGTVDAWGVGTGAEFYLPLYSGFWTNLGTGVEWMPFKYNLPSDPRGDGYDTSFVSGYLHAGVSYSF